jgi:hypothetical protein
MKDTGVLNTLLFLVWVGHGDPQDFGLTSSKGWSNCVLKVFWEAGEDWSKAGWVLLCFSVLVTCIGFLCANGWIQVFLTLLHRHAGGWSGHEADE